jgi:hypothetical protein
LEDVGKNAEDPRTVCVDVVEAFLRSTFLLSGLSGDRGGGGGVSFALVLVLVVRMDDLDDLEGEVDNVNDERDLLALIDGIRFVNW